MNFFMAYSWNYAPNPETSAQKFFQLLYDGIQSGKLFPFQKPYQVALFRNSYGALLVGVLVLTGNPGDDSVETHNALRRWYEECGYLPKSEDRFTDYESITVGGGSIRSSLDNHYTILSSFGSITGDADVKPPPKSAVNTVIAPQPEQKPKEAQRPISPIEPPKKVGIRIWFALVLGGVLSLAGFCLGFILVDSKITGIQGSPSLDTNSFIAGIACFSLAPLIIGLVFLGFGINTLRKKEM